MLRLINDKKVFSDKHFISDNGLLQKIVKENDKLCHTLEEPILFSECELHEAHDALDHNVIARTYQCLKWQYYWKRLQKDVNLHGKQCIKCRQLNLHTQHYAQLHLEVPSMPLHFIITDLIGTFKLHFKGISML